jgi:NAD(P)-dependent dehydrogenase (short-subunit alcohol dehydrogenase family)
MHDAPPIDGRLPLAGRVAFVTGAASGIGAATARRLARDGACVVGADLDLDGARRTIESCDTAGHAVALNVTDADACAAVVERCVAAFGPPRILVNAAGVLRRGPVEHPSERDIWRETFAVNVDGLHNVTMACLPHVAAEGAAIVNVASIHAFVATGVSAAYTASKGAIGQYTKALAHELAARLIRVNAVAPGIVRTAMTAGTLAEPAALAGFLQHVPLARVGEAEEIAAAIAFLASDEASYITGVVLPVDGGYLVR